MKCRLSKSAFGRSSQVTVVGSVGEFTDLLDAVATAKAYLSANCSHKCSDELLSFIRLLVDVLVKEGDKGE